MALHTGAAEARPPCLGDQRCPPPRRREEVDYCPTMWVWVHTGVRNTVRPPSNHDPTEGDRDRLKSRVGQAKNRRRADQQEQPPMKKSRQRMPVDKESTQQMDVCIGPRTRSSGSYACHNTTIEPRPESTSTVQRSKRIHGNDHTYLHLSHGTDVKKKKYRMYLATGTEKKKKHHLHGRSAFQTLPPPSRTQEPSRPVPTRRDCALPDPP